MSKLMRWAKNIIQRILLVNGEMLLGFCFVLIGALVLRLGLIKLIDLWRRLLEIGPVSFPENTGQWILSSTPLLFQMFVNVVSAACGVLIGALWIITGLADVIESRHTIKAPADFQSPDMVAESLRSSIIMGRRSPPWPARILSWIWPKARFMSPASYEVFEGIFWALWKLLLLGFLLMLLMKLLEGTPGLLRNLTEWKLNLFVPSMQSIYILLGLTALADIAVAASLVPFTGAPSDRSRASISFHGCGEPHIFFSLLEEASKLLSPRGEAHRDAVRVELEGDSHIKGTIVENAPSAVPSIGRPAAYLCIPIIAVVVVWGFSRMIHFQADAHTMPYQQFITSHLLTSFFHIALSLGLILVGLHLAGWARALFAIRTFRSYVLFAFITPDPNLGSGDRLNSARVLAYRPGELKWSTFQGVDEQLAAWARAPDTESRFVLEIFWTELISEAPAAGAPRYPVKGFHSEQLDMAVDRIIELPFLVSFEKTAFEESEIEPEELNLAQDENEDFEEEDEK